MNDVRETINTMLVKTFHEILELEEKAIITDEFSDLSNNDMHIIEAIGLGEGARMSVVAKRLNIPFYDQEIVDKAVAESGFTKEFIEEHGEYSTLSSVLLGTSAPFDSYYYAEDPQDKIFKIQRRIIKKFAQEGPCVIVG